MRQWLIPALRHRSVDVAVLLLVGLPACWGMWCIPAQAQPFAPGMEAPRGRQSDEAAGRAQAEGHETEAETIAKCLRDLQREDVSVRRRAVMILGKYRHPLAMQGVIRSLRDADADVRRSAVVSASEWPMLPAGAADEILRLVGDDDVHVRRLASSMLPDLVGGQSVRIGTDGGQIQILRPAGAAGDGGADRELLATILNAGMQDTDATVRRNLLKVAPYVSELLKRQTLESCLRDEDREIRVLAVRAYARLRGDEAVRAAALAGLVDDPDPTVRRELARALGGLGRAGFAALEALLEDPDAGVRLEGVREMLQLQHPDGLRLLGRVVLDDSVPSEERRDLVRYARLYGAAARPLLERLLDARSSVLRAEAVGALARLPEYVDNTTFFLGLLDDESVHVRREAAQVVAQRVARSGRDPRLQSELDATRLLRLFESPYSDVRELTLRLALYLPADERQALLVEACLDDDVTVRAQALRRLALLGTAAARMIVVRSLDDPNDEVVIAAIQGLASRPDTESLTALTDFLEACENPALKEVAAAAVARLRQALAQPGGARPRQVPRPPGTAGGNAAPVPPRRWPMRRE